MNKRTKWSDAEKAHIALMALKEEKTIAEIASETGAHPNMISKWKKQLLENADASFRNGKSVKEIDQEKEIDELHRQLGEAHAIINFQKKNLKKLGL